MIQGCENRRSNHWCRRAPRVSYRIGDVAAALAEAGTLAVFGFGAEGAAQADPRCLQVALERFDAPGTAGTVAGRRRPSAAAATATCAGRAAAAGCLPRSNWTKARTAARRRTARLAYAALRRVRGPQRRTTRAADLELPGCHQPRRAATPSATSSSAMAARCGMGDFFAEGFPAATAIGHHGAGAPPAGLSAGLRPARPAGGESAPGQRVALPAPVRPHSAQLRPRHGPARRRMRWPSPVPPRWSATPRRTRMTWTPSWRKP